MRAILRLILLLVILLPVLLLVAAWFSLQEEPLLLQTASLSHTDIARAKRIISRNDPRSQEPGTTNTIDISEHDLNLAANYLLQKHANGRASITLLPRLMRISATLQVPALTARPYLNLSLNLASNGQEAEISALQIGGLNIPDGLSRWLVPALLQLADRTQGYRLASTLIKELELDNRRLLLSYEWQPALIEAMRSQLQSPEQQAAMAAYHAALLEMQQKGEAVRGSLASALPGLFRLARSRSEESGDPVLENRSLLLVLGAWAGGRNMDRLLPPGISGQKPRRFRLTLERRLDFGQHFLISAGLVAAGDGSLADAVGLYKEMEDADGGSGFSFTDIAADRSGTRFGERATADAESASRLQQRISGGIRESDIIPAIRDLPEHMSGDEFRRRFGGVDQPAYRQMMTEIEQRIAACPIYRD